MDIRNIPFGRTTWSQIEPTEHRGESGMATWTTQQFDNIRFTWLNIVPATWLIIGAQKVIFYFG